MKPPEVFELNGVFFNQTLTLTERRVSPSHQFLSVSSLYGADFDIRFNTINSNLTDTVYLDFVKYHDYAITIYDVNVL